MVEAHYKHTSVRELRKSFDVSTKDAKAIASKNCMSHKRALMKFVPGATAAAAAANRRHQDTHRKKRASRSSAEPALLADEDELSCDSSDADVMPVHEGGAPGSKRVRSHAWAPTVSLGGSAASRSHAGPTSPNREVNLLPGRPKRGSSRQDLGAKPPS